MVETFYKIEVAKGKYTESAEYYTLALIPLTGSSYVVTEHHGWWDNVANKARLKTTILTNADEPTPEDEARRIYDEQRSYLPASVSSTSTSRHDEQRLTTWRRWRRRSGSARQPFGNVLKRVDWTGLILCSQLLFPLSDREISWRHVHN